MEVWQIVLLIFAGVLILGSLGIGIFAWINSDKSNITQIIIPDVITEKGDPGEQGAPELVIIGSIGAIKVEHKLIGGAIGKDLASQIANGILVFAK